MYCEHEMILIMYVYYTLFFGQYPQDIEKVISELEKAGYALTNGYGYKPTVFSFLGVSITPDPITKLL